MMNGLLGMENKVYCSSNDIRKRNKEWKFYDFEKNLEISLVTSQDYFIIYILLYLLDLAYGIFYFLFIFLVIFSFNIIKSATKIT